MANLSSNDISVLRGKGDGTFAAQMTLRVGDRPLGLVVQDFDRDGALDIAIANAGSNNVTVLLNRR